MCCVKGKPSSHLKPAQKYYSEKVHDIFLFEMIIIMCSDVLCHIRIYDIISFVFFIGTDTAFLVRELVVEP